MSITITKTKNPEPIKYAQLHVEVEPTEMPLEELADLYGALKDQTDALSANPLYTKFSEVAKVLAERINKEAKEPTDEVTIKGHHWVIEAGPCSKSPRKVTDVSMIAKYLGQETFYKLAKMSIADIDKYLTPDQVATVVAPEVGYTANRKITAKFLG